MIAAGLKDKIEKACGSAIQSATPVAGGSINHAFRLATSKKNYFLKYNDASAYPGMFKAEAKGLQLLQSAGQTVPGVIMADEEFLLLEWIEPGRRKKEFWESFGRQLAQLHLHRAKQFGLDHDNYIGSLTQN